MAVGRGRDPRRELRDHDGRQDVEAGRGGRDHRVWQVLCAAAAARTGRNLQTGEPVKIRASKTPRFAAGATLKTAVAGRRK